MSLKKITAIAIGGAMVASTLASGVAAGATTGYVEKIGDIEGFVDKIVVDGKPNVEVVVGSNAAAMDVVSASDISAWIGSMCYSYEDVVVEDGTVNLKVESSTDTELTDDLNQYFDGSQFLIFTTPKRIYTEALGKDYILNGLVTHDANATMRIHKDVRNAILEDGYINIYRANNINIDNGELNGTIHVTNGTTEEIYWHLRNYYAAVQRSEFDGTIEYFNGTDIITANAIGEASNAIINGRIDPKDEIGNKINGTISNETTILWGIRGILDNGDTFEGWAGGYIVNGTIENNNISGNFNGIISLTINHSGYLDNITGTINGNIEGYVFGKSENSMSAYIYINNIKTKNITENRALDINGLLQLQFSGSKRIEEMPINKAIRIEDGTVGELYVTNTKLLEGRFDRAMFTGEIEYSDTDVRVQGVSKLDDLKLVENADPNGISDTEEPDAIEFLLASVMKEERDDFKIDKGDLVYGTLLFKDGKKDIDRDSLQNLYTGMEIPLLGELYRVVNVDDKKIYLGKELNSAIDVREGTSLPVKVNGKDYIIKVDKVLREINNNDRVKVHIKILKDGKVVGSVSGETPYEYIYNNEIGIIVYEDVYTDVPGYKGYVSLIITDVKEYELGKDLNEDNKGWKLCAITRDGYGLKVIREGKFYKVGGEGRTHYLRVIDENKIHRDVYGLALVNVESSESITADNIPKEISFPDDYAVLEFTNDGTKGKMFAKYKKEGSKEVSISLGEHKHDVLGVCLEVTKIKGVSRQPKPEKVTTPIAKLDKETSLETDKYLILVGGPVANELTRKLQEEGKVSIDNESSPILQVVDNRILVVAGGDRHRTREAALHLIANY